MKYSLNSESLGLHSVRIDLIKFPDLAIQIMQKGINPPVIAYDEESKEGKELMCQFPDQSNLQLKMLKRTVYDIISVV